MIHFQEVGDKESKRKIKQNVRRTNQSVKENPCIKENLFVKITRGYLRREPEGAPIKRNLDNICFKPAI
tara:strand:- start:258 stop:464 length:207 start_codon:yes stop_codon:yes gene_type:complete